MRGEISLQAKTGICISGFLVHFTPPVSLLGTEQPRLFETSSIVRESLLPFLLRYCLLCFKGYMPYCMMEKIISDICTETLTGALLSILASRLPEEHFSLLPFAFPARIPSMLWQLCVQWGEIAVWWRMVRAVSPIHAGAYWVTTSQFQEIQKFQYCRVKTPYEK